MLVSTTNEHIVVSAESTNLAKEALRRCFELNVKPRVIAIAGESGSGKSVTAVSIQNVLSEMGFSPLCLHLDNYFHLAPDQNDQRRREALSNVGKEEVDLHLLCQHVSAFIEGKKNIEIPILQQEKSDFIDFSVNLSAHDILLIEGTYVFDISSIDCKIFIDSDFRKTRENRIKRGRDLVDQFSEQVLEIEHNIIKQYKAQADIVIGPDFKIQ